MITLCIFLMVSVTAALAMMFRSKKPSPRASEIMFPVSPDNIVPAAPKPMKRERTMRSRRPRNGFDRLTCRDVGEVVIIDCRDRHSFRRVTRAIDQVCGARKRGLDHKRYVRERKVTVHKEEMPSIALALHGAKYHELRATA